MVQLVSNVQKRGVGVLVVVGDGNALGKVTVLRVGCGHRRAQLGRQLVQLRRGHPRINLRAHFLGHKRTVDLEWSKVLVFAQITNTLENLVKRNLLLFTVPLDDVELSVERLLGLLHS